MTSIAKRTRLLLVALLAIATGAAETAATAATALLTRGPYLQNAAPTAITVRWRTDFPTDSRVWIGSTPGLPFLAVTDPDPTTEHEVRLVGLVPGTTYFYAVGSEAGPVTAADSSFSFVTPPPAGESRPTRIWVLGDSGTPTGGQRRVRDAYAAYGAECRTDVWLLLGDNAYESGTDSEFQAALFDPFASFLRRTCVWSTRGNHDDVHAGSADDYFDFFTLPTAGEAGGVPSSSEAWYSFDHGNIHFICLDSEGTSASRAPGSPMLTWLEADLAASDRTWVIAFWHTPPWSRGSHDSDDDERMIQMREWVMPVLEAHGVDLVLGGHSHSYERSFLVDGHYGPSWTLDSTMVKDGGDGDVFGDGDYRKRGGPPAPHSGVVAIVAGASSSLADGTLDHPIMVRSLPVLGSVVIDVRGDLLEAVYLDDLGVVRDRFAIRKGAVVDAASPPPGLRLAVASPSRRGTTDLRLTLAGPGPASLSIVDAAGRRRRALPIGTVEAGSRVVRWDGNDAAGRPLPPGLYFAVLEAAGTRLTRRFVLVP